MRKRVFPILSRRLAISQKRFKMEHLVKDSRHHHHPGITQWDKVAIGQDRGPLGTTEMCPSEVHTQMYLNIEANHLTEDHTKTSLNIEVSHQSDKDLLAIMPTRSCPVFLYWPFQGGTSVVVPYCSCCLCLYFGSSIMLVTYFVNFR